MEDGARTPGEVRQPGPGADRRPSAGNPQRPGTPGRPGNRQAKETAVPGFALDPEQQMWCERVRGQAAHRLRPIAEKGEPGRVNRPLLAELGRLGLLERLFPHQGRPSATELCLLRESLA